GAARGRVKAAVLIGEGRPQLRAALSPVTRVVEAAGMAEAVAEARRLAAPGEVVLLSPACASFDMFRDYEERGEVYKRLVHALEG
ncbi:MAG: UDP-N-acetylmuramoylalanine--D-glutamate ligase, partial [Candidatus Rokubacteria bacterium]|nr:UDP-N-acetylmuramoylalanine--D-glutamate ligase [Candidatus Rokubacteria bacterium]